MRGNELNQAANIKDGEFVHAAGFIGGCWSLASCVQIADDSIGYKYKKIDGDGFEIVC